MSLGVNLDDAAVVALGGNVAGDYGSSEALLEAALARFAEAGLPILRRSSWWRSAAWPDPNNHEYRNGVVLVEARLSPQALIQTLFMLESEFGRTRSVRNAPRTLDLDLIAHGRIISEDPALTLPHPRAHERLFVMGPLAEIAPDWRHPVLGKSASELALSASVGLDARPL
ncbi:2-amino-4-hydroxy-6-hydroxymethyldihydropteridine pyrophosphokinase [Phenylobacterium sp. Root77]|uniref:2-amino-4-hydroxy-6- hydroxymethyldihydropteridine diphosphokinase n=1 Tax=unclassified Phenylobacterium TaxID=2640670 RepID=UPI0006FADC82|nr:MULTISPECIES: 2-amino-4-hydroxy-6-hydroxymethyldihydropteridine diphosphokinase [unclassified Phenylobacterium]KQW71431.1 2-amino-4-hydroxy-6-hydroxymethyldihydropteridine pyrophosphokinase [Phenylobacterium sp. Root1277]KQW94351.1 2-amino-4-hydroxy-6-hydroxymethyldihydropteridine pyrophosphokinase [Phenylobacterium sp. Root1290]KRC44045.1 2-amino-4-hydroxy-6-hydroxymethyldihydropteridine pyrophosphokinase [Phenylobacterium sp. Root77]